MWPWLPQIKKQIWNESFSPSHHHTSVAVCSCCTLVCSLSFCQHPHLHPTHPAQKKKKKKFRKKNHFALLPRERASSAPLCASPSSSFLPSCLSLPLKFWLWLITRRLLILPYVSVFMIADPYWSASKHCTCPLSPTIHRSVCVCRFQFTRNRFVQIWELRDEVVG